MTNYSYQQLVNQHLSSARQLLALANDGETHIARQRACLESALLQTHFALHHYINELLASYHRPDEQAAIWQLYERMTKNNYGLAELREWQQLASTEGSFVFVVLYYPTMLAQGTLLFTASNPSNLLATSSKSMEASDLISVVNLEDKGEAESLTLVLDKATVTWVVDECYQLIQRQREHLLEC